MFKPILLVVVALVLSLPTLAQQAMPARGADAAVLVRQGDALEAAGKHDQALVAYDKAIAAYTAQAQALDKEANALRAAGKDNGAKSDEAIAIWDLVVQASAKAINAEKNKGTAPSLQPAVAKPDALPAIEVAPLTEIATPLKVITLPPMAPKAGTIRGRVVSESGDTVPNFTVEYSGFEVAKGADTNGVGQLTETFGGKVEGHGGAYSIKVPQGAYRVSAYVTYVSQGRTYNFDAEPLNPPFNHDHGGGLDNLGDGLVRDFVLKMTAKKAGASGSSRTLYQQAYYGGFMYFDCGQIEKLIGVGGRAIPPSLATTYPPESRLLATLTPHGPMVDGSAGHIVNINLRLGDNGKYTLSQRGIYPGVYTATASLTTPDGETIPLRLSATPSRYVQRGGPKGEDAWMVDWAPSVTVDFLPNDLGPMPRFGVKAIGLYAGK